MRKKGATGIGSILFILALLYGGYIAYQYAMNAITVKSLRAKIKEGLFRKLPISDWEKAIDDVVTYYANYEKIPPESIEWDYTIDEAKKVFIDLYYTTTINYVFKKEKKVYYFKVFIDPEAGL